MEIYLKILQQEELEPVYLSYYKFFEKLFGKTNFSASTKKMLKAGGNPTPLTLIIDSNYNRTVNAIAMAYNELKCIMLGAYDMNSNLLAVGRVKLGVPNNENNALMGEIVLIEDNMANKQKEELYTSFIAEVENAIKELQNIEMLTFEVPKTNAEYMTAVGKMGYILEPVNGGQITCLFDKHIDKITNRRK
ncbi:MAG: hypothetical protein E7164_01085 [Firmicutes bacterium]|nr:hypothetical protein [Bacillota bacterium]